eukprot:g11356.t1
MERLVGAAVVAFMMLSPLMWNLGRCWKAILNDARIISRDPALQSKLEILFAYPGFWALFWYRLSHALLQQDLPVISPVLPRLVMSIVRYCTSIDIHPAATISGGGIFIDHGAGLVVGAEAVIGAGVTLYHGVTLGVSGKKVLPGAKRHPTIGDRVVVGAGAKVLGDIVIGDDVLVGANTVVTKAVPANHTAVGVPARILCHGAATGKDVAGAAICELHQRLMKVERKSQEAGAEADVAAGKEEGLATAQQKQQHQQLQRQLQQAAGEGREPPSLTFTSPEPLVKKTFGPSPSSSPLGSGALELSSPGIDQQQQEQQHLRKDQRQQEQPPSLASSSVSEGGMEQILYSQQILSAGA